MACETSFQELRPCQAAPVPAAACPYRVRYASAGVRRCQWGDRTNARSSAMLCSLGRHAGRVQTRCWRPCRARARRAWRQRMWDV